MNLRINLSYQVSFSICEAMIFTNFKRKKFIDYIFFTTDRENQSLSATRNKVEQLLLFYNTLSATRKVLRSRLSIVEKITPGCSLPRRG